MDFYTVKTTVCTYKYNAYFQNSKELSNKPIRVRAPIIWGDEEIEQLKKLYEEYKDAVDPVNRIIDHLIVKRPKKRVIEKIMGKWAF